MESDSSSRRGWSLREKTWKCYTDLLSIAGIRSKSQLSEDTLKSAGIDPVEAKATHNGGEPTFSYPCYPPWDEDKTFRKMNTDTTYARPAYRKASELPDWVTTINFKHGGNMKIGWAFQDGENEDAA